MENAGRGAAVALRRRLGPPPVRVLVACGLGNNGGDGFVVARLLKTFGYDVRVVLLSNMPDLSGDAAINCRAWCGLGGAVTEELDEACPKLYEQLQTADVVVDALFGTGLSRALGGRFLRAVQMVNEAGLPCYALDIPSGLDAETGAVHGACVRAKATFTFAHPKLGLLTNSGAAHVGELEVLDIGVPAELFRNTGQAAWLTEAADVAAMLGARRRPAHKGEAGRVAVIAGSPGTVGAAQLVARGAFRAGAGLVTVASFPEAITQLESEAWETMTHAIDLAQPGVSLAPLMQASAMAVGPGLGLGSLPISLTEHVVSHYPGPLVVDADALTHFQERASDLADAAGRLILTPHPAEAGRLLGISAREVEADRFAAVRELVRLTQAVVLLKGVRTIVAAPEREPVVNTSGTSALATAGSGDVLTWIISALACSLSPWEAAICGAWLHGSSAELWSAEHGLVRGMLAREIADGVPRAVAAISGTHR